MRTQHLEVLTNQLTNQSLTLSCNTYIQLVKHNLYCIQIFFCVVIIISKVYLRITERLEVINGSQANNVYSQFGMCSIWYYINNPHYHRSLMPSNILCIRRTKSAAANSSKTSVTPYPGTPRLAHGEDWVCRKSLSPSPRDRGSTAQSGPSWSPAYSGQTGRKSCMC